MSQFKTVWVSAHLSKTFYFFCSKIKKRSQKKDKPTKGKEKRSQKEKENKKMGYIEVNMFCIASYCCKVQVFAML